MKIMNSQAQLRALVDELRLKISNDEYIIIPREKNKRFMRTYRLSIAKSKSILMLISETNYISEEFDLDSAKYGVENVVIFKVKTRLIDIYGIEAELCIYIKIKKSSSNIPIISFHEDEEGLK